MKMLRQLTLCLSVAVLATAGCGKKDEKAKDEKGQETPATGDNAGENAGETPAAKAASKIPVDAELMAAIDAVVGKCEIDVKQMRIKCSGDEDKALKDLFGYSAPKKMPLGTIATMAVALNDDDAKKRTVAANILGNKHGTGWGKDVKPGSVSKDVVAELLAAVPKLGQYQGRRSITAIAYAAGLAGETEAFFKTIDASADDYLKQNGYAGSMFYGRMAAFPKVEELSKSDDPKMKLAAVSAAANMYKYTDEEKAKICPWAHGLAGADAPDVKESAIFEQVGMVLQRCGGEWIDKLLDFGESQLKDHNRFDRRYYFVFRNLCFSMMGEKSAADDKQCERNYKFLESAANNDKLSGRDRAFALDAIPYQRRDATSLKLVKKYQKSKVPEIKKAAEDAIKMLESYVNKKK